MPLVSVIVSTYNRGPLLTEAIASVRAQSYVNLEVLVCDDGSTDDTARRMMEQGGPVRHLRLEHAGSPGRTRNRGIEAARGELVAFLDDDDLWRPDKLARQVAALESDPGAGLAYTDAQLLLPDGSLSDPVLPPHHEGPGSLFLRLVRSCFLQPSIVLIRREVLLRGGLFDEALDTGEDYDLWLRLSRTTRAVCVPEPLVLIRRNAASRSGASGLRPYENAIAVLRRQLAGGSLSVRERLACIRAIAGLHATAGATALRRRDLRAARRHALRSLLLNPPQRRAWSILLAGVRGDGR